MMKILLPLAACAALAGCVGYADAQTRTWGPNNGHRAAQNYDADPTYNASGGTNRPGDSVTLYGTYRGGDRIDRNDRRWDDRRDEYRARNRDRDRDGVPDRYDSRPDNPRRR